MENRFYAWFMHDSCINHASNHFIPSEQLSKPIENKGTIELFWFGTHNANRDKHKGCVPPASSKEALLE